MSWRTVLLTAVVGYASVKFIRFLFKLHWGKIDRNNEISVDGKLVLITGANSGIGKQTALEMAERGATVVLCCRDLGKAQDAIEDIRKVTTNGHLTSMKLDLSSLDSVRQFAKEFKSKYNSIDILINNGGLYSPIRKKAKTRDGFEIHMGVNHLGHFLLTNLLLEQVKNAAPSRIVTLSSLLHNLGEIDFEDLMSENKGHYKETLATNPLYSNSKLANAYFNKELGRRLKGSGVTSYGLCPGLVTTNMSNSVEVSWYWKPLAPLFLLISKTPKEGALTSLYCALSKDVAKQSGEMYQHCHLWEQKNRIMLEDKVSEKLWTVSEKLVGLN